MAKTNRQILQHLRTSGSTTYVQTNLKDNAVQGEIAIQYDGEAASGTSLWTLAKDNTAVQFVNKEQVADMIKNGAVAEVDKIETAVGLAEDGTYIKKSGTTYLNDATTVEGEIAALDKALSGVQGQIDGMDATSVADDNKIVSDVIQTDGKITATAKNVTEVKLGGYTVGGDDSGKVEATDTLGTALGKLQGQINGMDAATVADDNKIVSDVIQTDGKITASAKNVTEVKLSGYTVGGDEKVADTDTLGQALGKLQGQINGMDAATVAGEDKIVSDVIQTDGKISATTKNVTEVKLGGYTVGGDDSGKVEAGDTLGQALGKLQGQINGMDKAAEDADGQVITTISQVDGKVSETKANVKDLQLGGYEKTTATGAIEGTDTINVALSKLENKANAITISNTDGSINVTSSATGTDINVNIKSGESVIKKDGNGGLYTNLNLVKISDESLPTTVKERYELRDSDGARIGESIDIAKDSHIVSITYITDSGDTHYQNLEYKYIDVNGAEQTEYVDISSLVLEAEFKDGLEVVNHQVKAKIDASSEKDSQGTPVSFLTVGPDGLKLSGVKEEITRKIEALDYTDTAVTGQYVTEVNEADGKISVARANVSDAVLNGYVKGEKPTNTAIAATDDVKGAIAKLEHQIDAAKAAATTKVKKDAQASHLTLSSSTAADGSVTYTIGESDIASKTDLDAEIAARKAVDGQTGETYVANANSNYIKAVDSLNAADVQLDAILGKDERAGAETVFDTTNTVAKNISDIKKDLAAFKNKLTLSVADDDKYIATSISTADSGTVITVSAITKDIATSTSGASAIADSYNVKRFAVSQIKADEGVSHHASGVEIVDSGTDDGFKQLSFAKLTIDCGEF